MLAPMDHASGCCLKTRPWSKCIRKCRARANSPYRSLIALWETLPTWASFQFPTTHSVRRTVSSGLCLKPFRRLRGVLPSRASFADPEKDAPNRHIRLPNAASLHFGAILRNTTRGRKPGRTDGRTDGHDFVPLKGKNAQQQHIFMFHHEPVQPVTSWGPSCTPPPI